MPKPISQGEARPRKKPLKKPLKKPRVTERSVEHELTTLLGLHGWQVHKLEVMQGVEVDYQGRGKRRFSQGTPGDPDLIAVRPYRRGVYPDWGESLYIETKAIDGKLSKIQKARHAVLRRDGHVVIVARSWNELVGCARMYKIEVKR